MSAQRLNPPSFGEGNAFLYSDTKNRLLQKWCNNVGGASHAAAVTPSDSVDLARPAKIFVGTGGTIKVNCALTGTTLTVQGVAGKTLPVTVSRVWATGTSASNLVAVW